MSVEIQIARCAEIRRKITSVFIVLLLLCTSVHAGPEREITVSAATSLKNAFEKIGKLFEAKHKPDGRKILEKYGFKVRR